MANENKRVNVYMNAKVLDKLDEYAEKLGLSRSSAISVIVYEYFRTEEAASALAEMNELKRMLQGLAVPQINA